MVEGAYIFPGQGAQYVGMGRPLYENDKRAREVFECANQTLGFDLARLCFEGPDEELEKASNNSLAVLTTSIASLRSLEARSSDLKKTPQATAGLSLGEYSALVCAGSIPFEDALRIVRRRAEFMEEASRQNPGGMAAVIGLSWEEVEEICRATTGVQIANRNCPGQVVVSGTNLGIEEVTRLARTKSAKGVVQLDVSGAFHSSLMDGASEKLREELKKFEIKRPLVPFVANISGDYEENPEEIKQNLAKQVNHPTLWEKSVRNMASRGIKTFIEIGPGKVLKGLIRRIDSKLKVYNAREL